MRCMAVPEGHTGFSQRPMVIVRGPVVQAQLLETMLLLTINHQSLIATKANRIARGSPWACGDGIQAPAMCPG